MKSDVEKSVLMSRKLGSPQDFRPMYLTSTEATFEPSDDPNIIFSSSQDVKAIERTIHFSDAVVEFLEARVLDYGSWGIGSFALLGIDCLMVLLLTDYAYVEPTAMYAN